MFKKNNRRKRTKLTMNKNKAMIIPDRICQKKKLFVTVNPKNTYRLESLIIYGYYFLINHSKML